MYEILPTTIVLIFGVLMCLGIQRMLAPWERPLVWLSFAAHAVSSVAMVLLTVYFFGGGDMLAYHSHGELHASRIWGDFLNYSADLFRYTMRMPTVNYRFFLSQSSTGAMMGLSGWMAIVLGSSLYAMCMAVAMVSFASKYLLYKGLQMSLPQRFHKRALLGAMLLPSVVFWSSGLLKEPIAMIGLGPAFWGLAQLIQGPRRGAGLAAMLVGCTLIGLVKSYILFPLWVCGGVWFYWHYSLTTTGKVAILKQPLYLIAAAVIGVVSVQGLGVIFPEYSIANVADEAAGLQAIGQRVKGGSGYTITTGPSRSLAGQLAIAPIGLLFSLFRPLPFEVRNIAVLLNAIEIVILIWLWIKCASVRAWRQTAKMLFSSPMLMFCVAFCIFFGAAVGISSTNVGTLSRYRVPMMPFYAVALLVLSMASARPGRTR